MSAAALKVALSFSESLLFTEIRIWERKGRAPERVTHRDGSDAGRWVGGQGDSEVHTHLWGLWCGVARMA